MTENSLSLDKQLCFPIYAASHLINRLYRPLLDELGVTYPQYLVLLVLWEQQTEMTVGEVCQRLQLDSGTVTPLLKRLEMAGILKRVRSKEEERRNLRFNNKRKKNIIYKRKENKIIQKNATTASKIILAPCVPCV